MNYLEINQNLWNKKTDIHFESDFYNVKDFIKGKSSLNSIELDLLGDIKGKSVLHLQCHFGMDSISLARLGAKVTAIDLSDRAIEKARELAEQTNTEVEFIQSDVLNLKEVLNDTFDIVFTSYGTIGWLPDMNKWAEVVAHFMKPQGQFIMAEFHPVIWMFDYDFTKVEYGYFNSGAIVEELEGTYTDENTSSAIKEKSISWNHTLSDVMQALLNQNLTIFHFKEYDYSPYNCFNNTFEIEPGKFMIKGLENKLPMVYSIVASKVK